MRDFIRNLFVKPFRKQIVPGLLVLSLALLSGCGGGGGGAGAPITGTEVVGETGGTATSSDGKASVEIPPNALSGERQITITQTTGSPPANFGKGISPVYDFGPDGLTFSKPATITIHYNLTDLSQNVLETDLRLAMESNGRWEILTNSTVDTVNHQIIAQTTHFTGFEIVEPDNVLANALGFPLLSRGPYKDYRESPFITSVFDHSMAKRLGGEIATYCPDGKVIAYNGNEGSNSNKKVDCKTDIKPKSFNDTEIVNGYLARITIPNYSGSKLSYDGHPGIDYGVPSGTPVYSSAKGTILSIQGTKENPTLNGALKIDHGNGYQTWYLHLSKYKKSSGTVESGELIGWSGDQGVKGAFHLHFEVRKDNIPLDPYGWTDPSKSDPYQPQPDLPGNSIILWPHKAKDSQNDSVEFSSETIPDGKMMSSGELFSKDWTVKIRENNTLNSSYRLRYLSGALSVSHQDVLPEKGANSQYTFSVPMKAPLRPGKYKEDWEIVNQKDEHLGTLWALIEVDQNVLPPSTPTADIVVPVNGASFSVGETVSFQGSGGASYLWEFGDSARSTLQSPSHIYTLPNTYTVSLTVTDANGRQARASISILVRSVVSDPTLLVTVNGTGSGAISSSPLGINNCRATCSASFPLSRMITLTASASPGSTFVGWSEDCMGSTLNGCTLRMNGNHSVTATFATDVFTITATSLGNGSISPTSTAIVNRGSSQTFTITPAANNRIVDVLVDGFSVGTVTTHTFSDVTSNRTIHAIFALADTSSPTAAITSPVNGSSFSVGHAISFQGTGGVSYSWQFGDGAISTLQSPSHTYSTPGPYTVALTVFDATGGQDPTSISITVQSVASEAPVISAPISGVVPGVFTTNGGMFELSVSPLDPAGELISAGLSLANFSFTPITVADATDPNGLVVTSGSATPISIEIVQPNAEGLTVVLLFDSSGSMEFTDLTRLRVDAGKQFISRLGPNDQAAIMDFTTGSFGFPKRISVLQTFTSDHTLLNAGIDQVTQDGGTPLYDALLEAITLLNGTSASKPVIVVLSDGDDRNSSSSFIDVLNQVKASNIPIFPIGLGSGNLTNIPELQDLAAQTGGTFASVQDATGLTDVFDKIATATIKGRIVVNAEGTFNPPLGRTGTFIISGSLITTSGGNTIATPFDFPTEIIGSSVSNGTIATATALPLPTPPVNGSIDPLGDVDFYRFSASAGNRVTIDIDAAVIGSNLDSVLRLFDSSGVEIAFNDDDATGSLDSFIDQVLSPAGDYFIAVSAFSDSFTGAYTLSVALGGGQTGSTLTVNPNGGPGSGTVTSIPAGIDCGATCSFSFPSGTSQVTLSALADTGSSFIGWSDPSCPGTAPCVVAMNGTPSVTATFELAGGGGVNNIGSLSISGAGTNVVGTSFNPDFRKRQDLTFILLLDWSDDGGNIVVLPKKEINVVLVGGEVRRVRFTLTTDIGSGVVPVRSIASYVNNCLTECGQVTIDLTAKTITFTNLQVSLSSVSSGSAIDTGPIFLNGTLRWQ